MENVKLDEFKEIGISLSVTPNQLEYLKNIRKSVITFVSAQAGCGKTYLAVAEGLRSLQSGYKKDKKIESLVLIRPAVTAGEKIGFLPGDLEEKTSFYMQPFNSSGCKLIGKVGWEKLTRDGLVEFETISFVQGKTWENSFIIVDEAQNCTCDQIKLLLTRLGRDSKMVIAGDRDQSYLHEASGFAWAMARIRNIKGIAVSELTEEDNMRHPILRQILKCLSNEIPPVVYGQDFSCIDRNNDSIKEEDDDESYS